MPVPGALKWVLAIALTLLALSMCANVLLGRSLLVAFEQLQFARVFPLGYAPNEAPGTVASGAPARADDASAPAVGTRETIALWGDSRAYLWDTADLARERGVENFAHGGQSSAQLLLQLQTVPPTHSTYSIVQIGINDLHPLGALKAHKQQILDGLRANIGAIRDALLERSDRVVLTTIFPPGPLPLQRRFSWDPQTLGLIEATNRVISEAADGRRVVVLDAYSLLRDERGLLDARYADDDFFLHVNRAAYARLNSELSVLLTIQPYEK